VERTSTILLVRSSPCATGVGNFPAEGTMSFDRLQEQRRERPLERPGPRRRGICLIRVSEARKASYFFASFLTSFLFLLSLHGKQIEHFETNSQRKHQLFQVIGGHILEVDLFRAVNICCVCENADGHAWPWYIG